VKPKRSDDETGPVRPCDLEEAPPRHPAAADRTTTRPAGDGGWRAWHDAKALCWASLLLPAFGCDDDRQVTFRESGLARDDAGVIVIEDHADIVLEDWRLPH
jgi:hypothetical protein